MEKKRSIPPLPRGVIGRDNQKFRRAWKRFFNRIHYPWFITLNPNNPNIPPHILRECIGHFLARIDRRALGANWSKKTTGRTRLVGVLERGMNGWHCHAKCRLPYYYSEIGQIWLQMILDGHWRAVMPSGSANLKRVYRADGLSHYITKQCWRPEFDDGVVIEAEFWPQGHRKNTNVN